MAVAQYEKLARWLCFHSQYAHPDHPRTTDENGLAMAALDDVERLLANGDEAAFHELAALRTRYNGFGFSVAENDNTDAHPFQTD